MQTVMVRKLVWVMAVAWSAVWGTTSCESLPARTDAWPLAPAIAFTPARELTQSIMFERGEEQLRLVGRLQFDDQGLVMVAFTPVGQRLFTIEYTSQGLVLDRSVAMPDNIDLMQVLGDLQLVHWPIADLEDAFGDDWVIRQSNHDRRLLHQGQVVREIRGVGPRRVEVLDSEHRCVIQVETLAAKEN